MRQTSSPPIRLRSLTADELKAAEAAFQGRPFNDRWSEAARTVYDGILPATRKRHTSFREAGDHHGRPTLIEAEAEGAALLGTAETRER
ncbi:hypothetical protein [Nitrospira sp. Kam-Ns4a]